MTNTSSPFWSTLTNAALTYAAPPVTLWRYGRILLGLDKTDPEAGFRPHKQSPEASQRMASLMLRLGQLYHRVEFEGMEHIPPTGPGLVVGTHNGGLQPLDSFFTGAAIILHRNPAHPTFGLGHDYIFRDPSLAAFCEQVGILRAHPRACSAAFAHNGMAIVYPGGDLDTFKPYRERHQINLGQRKGFLKLAIRHGVPIYPAVSVGAHEGWVVLTRGDRLGRLLGLKKRLRTEVFPLVLSLPWGLTSGFLPYLPLPTKIVIRMLAPHAWPHLSPVDADDHVVLQRCYDEVTGSMQAAIDDLASRRRFPVVG